MRRLGGHGKRLTYAEKAYPQLTEDVREQLALYHFLSLIDDTQLAISVKQRRPPTLDEAVSATLEVEAILATTGKPLRVAGVDDTASTETPGSSTSVGAATTQGRQDTTLDLLKTLVERVEKLEMNQRSREPLHPSRLNQRGNRFPLTHQGSVICRNCGQEGHYARGCAAPRGRRSQGN